MDDYIEYLRMAIIAALNMTVVESFMMFLDACRILMLVSLKSKRYVKVATRKFELTKIKTSSEGLI